VPVPGDISAAFYSLAEALEMMRRDAGTEPQTQAQEGTDTTDTDPSHDLLTTMIQSLLSQADTPPREVEGVTEEFCDSEMRPQSQPVLPRGAMIFKSFFANYFRLK
jgi:hypothetical protein